MDIDNWESLDVELDRWQAVGKVARFWLRDDDAVEPTPALERLLALTSDHAVPLALAVIPAHTGQALATHLSNRPLASVCVHGWSHANHAGANEKKQELGPQRPLEMVVAELRAGFDHLQKLYPGSFTLVLVPPWNRIAEPLIMELPGLGFKALSVFGPEKAGVALQLVNTHVDLMDWHGTRGARSDVALIADIVRRLAQMFDTGGVIGLLTHHIVHDEAGWRFLQKLFERTQRHPACDWRSLTDMLAER